MHWSEVDFLLGFDVDFCSSSKWVSKFVGNKRYGKDLIHYFAPFCLFFPKLRHYNSSFIIMTMLFI